MRFVEASFHTPDWQESSRPEVAKPVAPGPGHAAPSETYPIDIAGGAADAVSRSAACAARERAERTRTLVSFSMAEHL
ncbi:hypothetical protein C1X39_21715 [Pseudomonas sp. GW456-12-1-14-TSB1]|nr:hypothetical protein C1X39_21715 [Pseudomonas sp. GW456-12-1-14-TSB1]